MRVGFTVLFVVLALMLLCRAGYTQSDTLWNKLNAAGEEAYEQGRYTEVEKNLLAGLKEAEKFGPEDPRLAVSLNNLGVLDDTQGITKTGDRLLFDDRSMEENPACPFFFPGL